MTTAILKFKVSWKGLVAAALLGWIYYPTFVWMADRWTAADSYFAHGPLIPLVTLFWLWQGREELAGVPKGSNSAGMGLLMAGALMQIFASVFRVYFISAFSFVIILSGAVLSLYGWQLFKRVWYPLLFLFLMIPLPLLVVSEITLKLKFFVSEMAMHVLNFAGIATERNGSYLVLPHAYLLVGDPCSGLRSFLAFLCLGFVFAYGKGLGLAGKVALVFCGLPLAIFSNVLRVLALGLIAEIYGEQAAGGKVHDASGIIVFIIAFLIFMALRQKLEKSHA